VEAACCFRYKRLCLEAGKRRGHNMAQFYRRPMMHFDRRELYTDLETRVRYLHSFLDFSSRMFACVLFFWRQDG
jgi:hypothetical protein